MISLQHLKVAATAAISVPVAFYASALMIYLVVALVGWLATGSWFRPSELQSAFSAALLTSQSNQIAIYLIIWICILIGWVTVSVKAAAMTRRAWREAAKCSKN